MFVPRGLPSQDKLAQKMRRLKGNTLEKTLRIQRDRESEKHRILDSTIGRLIAKIPVERNQLFNIERIKTVNLNLI